MKTMNATSPAKGATLPAGPTTDGERSDVGSSYSAELVERDNKANTRNQGPSRAGLIGELGSASAADRKTGRVG